MKVDEVLRATTYVTRQNFDFGFIKHAFILALCLLFAVF